MKRGRPSWTTKCPPETLRLVHEAVDAGVDSATAIRDRLNLARYVGASAFRDWVAARRRDRRDRLQAGHTERDRPEAGPPAQAGPPQPDSESPPSPPSSAPSPAGLFDRLLAEMDTSVARGGVRLYELASAIKSLLALRYVETKENADRRAEELHELKLAELRKRQAAALDDVSKSIRLSDEQLAEIRARVLGI